LTLSIARDACAREMILEKSSKIVSPAGPTSRGNHARNNTSNRQVRKEGNEPGWSYARGW